MEKVGWENTQYLKNGEILKSGEKRKFCKGYGLWPMVLIGVSSLFFFFFDCILSRVLLILNQSPQKNECLSWQDISGI